MMNRYIGLLVILLVMGVSGQAKAQEIYTAPLYATDLQTYTPFGFEYLDSIKLRALKEKDSKAMFIIGMMYKDGNNVETSYFQAREWFTNAAMNGNSDAMIELSKLYITSKKITGFDENELESQKWIREAEKKKNPKAYYALGQMYEEGDPFGRSYEEAINYFKKAAYYGIINAYVKLYIAYQYGKGVDPDLEKAIYWLRKVQKESNDKKVTDYATQMLGEIYFELGIAEPEDELKFKLLSLSWGNGNRYALEALGDMYQSGRGVKQDYAKAILSYNTAIEKYESVYAMERLGIIYLKGPDNIRRDYVKAAELFKRGADLGGVTAAYMMGYTFFYGLGVERNQKEADKWFKRSSQLSLKMKKDKAKIKRARSTTSVASGAALKDIILDATIRSKEKEKQRRIDDKEKAKEEQDIMKELQIPAGEY